MESINDLYNELSKNYSVEWIDDKSFYVYFDKYRAYVDSKYIGYFVKKKRLFSKKTFWKDITHDHYDDSNYDLMYKDILGVISKY